MIALLFVGVAANYLMGQAAARDEIRKVHLEQIRTGITLFREKYERYPSCTIGMTIEPNPVMISGGNTTVIPVVDPHIRVPFAVAQDDNSDGRPDFCVDGVLFYDFLLNEVFEEMPFDPLGPNNPDYFYYYDSEHMCAGAGTDDENPLLFAVNMEVAENSNPLEICGAHEGNGGGYVRTDNRGGTINPSQPYAIRLVDESEY